MIRESRGEVMEVATEQWTTRAEEEKNDRVPDRVWHAITEDNEGPCTLTLCNLPPLEHSTDTGLYVFLVLCPTAYRRRAKMRSPLSYGTTSSILLGLSRRLQQTSEEFLSFHAGGGGDHDEEHHHDDEESDKPDGSVGAAFALAFGAGAFSLMGATIIFCTKHFDAKTSGSNVFVAGSLALAAGVMLYVSLVDIVGHSVEHFEAHGYSHGKSGLFSSISYFLGMLTIYLLDLVIHRFITPDAEHGHAPRISGVLLSPLASAAATTNPASEGTSPRTGICYQQQKEDNGGLDRSEAGYSLSKKELEETEKEKHFASLRRVGIMSAIAIGLHNIPEGFATYVGAIHDFNIGAAIALAIAVHNIPEGFAIAVPVYCSTGSKAKACLWSLIATFAEPFGAFLAWIVLSAGGDGTTISEATFGWLFGLVGGMMTMVVLHELLPSAFALDPHNKVSTFGIVLGMFIMAVSLVLFAYTE